MKKSTLFIIFFFLLACTTTFAQGGICGDVNNSGYVEIVDALIIAQIYVGLNPADYEKCLADVNGDGLENIIDALLIARYYVGLLTELNGCPVDCHPDGKTIILVIDPAVEPGIRSALDQFTTDLHNDGYSTLEHILTETTPVELKDYVYSRFMDPGIDLDGVILIGDFPKPYYRYYYPESTGGSQTCPERGPDELISLQFYQDLDGNYSLENPENAEHNYCYDTHTGEIFSEIWISVLPFFMDYPTTITGINDYFMKNHEYRTGIRRAQPGFVEPLLGSQLNTPEAYASQIDYVLNSAYAWKPLTTRGNIFIGADNTLDDMENYPNAAYCYETAMMTDLYDFADIGAHGSCTSFSASGGSIVINVAWAETHSIKPNFLWDTSCNTGNIDCQPNLHSVFIYNPDNNVVVTKGATHPQGGIGGNVNGSYRANIGSALSRGVSFGNAILEHINEEFTGCYEQQREYFLSQYIVFGDGTLRLQEFM